MPVAHVQHRPKRSVDGEVRSTKQSVGIIVIKNQTKIPPRSVCYSSGWYLQFKSRKTEEMNSYRRSLCNIPETLGKSRKFFVEFERKKIARNSSGNNLWCIILVI